jgi:hypothetical protein
MMKISDAIVSIPVQAGVSYLIVPDGNAEAKLQFSAISGKPATEPKKLGSHYWT